MVRLLRILFDIFFLCNEIYSEKVKDLKREDWVLWLRGKRFSLNYILIFVV